MKSKLVIGLCMALSVAALTLFDAVSQSVSTCEAFGGAHGDRDRDRDRDHQRIKPGAVNPGQPTQPEQPKPISVPAPSSLLLVGAGIAGLGTYVVIKRRRK